VQCLFLQDEELEKFTTKLTEAADLDTATMKSLTQQVFDNYPGVDLTKKKDLIRGFIKKVNRLNY
jgi:hypothetical protein